MGLNDHPGRESRTPEIADLAGVHEIAQGRQRECRRCRSPGLDGGSGTGRYSPVRNRRRLASHSEMIQRPLELRLPGWGLAHLPVEFRGQHHLLAPPSWGRALGQKSANYFFGFIRRNRRPRCR